VQWLRERLEEQIPEKMDIVCFWLYLAEGKEKKQIVESYYAGTAQFDNAAPIVNPKTPEEYYVQTYGGKNE
jgi:hypothetical protein